jgi:hypothetical protein
MKAGCLPAAQLTCHRVDWMNQSYLSIIWIIVDPSLILRYNESLSITLWLFNIAMENGPFIDGLPNLKMGGSFHGYVK